MRTALWAFALFVSALFQFGCGSDKKGSDPDAAVDAGQDGGAKEDAGPDDYVVPGNPGNVSVLVMVPEGYGANTWLARNRMNSWGWTVTTTSVTKQVSPCSSYAGPLGCPIIEVDALVGEIGDLSQFDALLVMPSTKWAGDPGSDLMASEEALALIRRADEEDLVVAAWCSTVRVLAAAGILDGVQVTGSPNYSSEYASAGASFLGENLPPVKDGNIITLTRGDYFDLINMEAVAMAIDEKGFTVAADDHEEGLARGAYDLSPVDGGYYLTGYAVRPQGGYDMSLQKVDSQGQPIWSRFFGEEGMEVGNSVSTTDDGGAVVAGYSTSDNRGNRDLLVIRTDGTGQELWRYTYCGAQADVAQSVAVALNGDLIIAGFTASSGAGMDDLLLIRLSPTGDEIWFETYGGDKSDRAFDVVELTGGDIAAAGSTGSFGAGNRDAYMVRVDASGAEIWTETYGGADFDWGEAVVEDDEGNLVIAGCTDKVYTELRDVLVVKAGSDGGELWRESFGESTFYDFGMDIVKLGGGSYMVAGGTYDATLGTSDAYLLEIDTHGNQLQTTLVGDNSNQWADAILNSGNTIITAGYTDESGAMSIFFDAQSD